MVQPGRNFWGFEGDSLIIVCFLFGCFFCPSGFCPIERLLFVSINTISQSLSEKIYILSFSCNCPKFLQDCFLRDNKLFRFHCVLD